MNDETITAEVIKEWMGLKDTSEPSSKHVLPCAQRIEGKRAHKRIIRKHEMQKTFHSIRRDRQIPDQNRQQREGIKVKKVIENNKYCGVTHPQ